VDKCWNLKSHKCKGGFSPIHLNNFGHVISSFMHVKSFKEVVSHFVEKGASSCEALEVKNKYSSLGNPYKKFLSMFSNIQNPKPKSTLKMLV